MSYKWNTIKNFSDIKYESGSNGAKGIAKITINRPKVRNAFRPQTVFELKEAFTLAREDQNIGVIILTGEGEKAFCSGGDQKIRGDKGYVGEFAKGFFGYNSNPNLPELLLWMLSLFLGIKMWRSFYY